MKSIKLKILIGTMRSMKAHPPFLTKKQWAVKKIK